VQVAGDDACAAALGGLAAVGASDHEQPPAEVDVSLAESEELSEGVDIAFDAIGGSHFSRSFACLAPGGLLACGTGTSSGQAFFPKQE
jgi:NADPH:quinone reductase-like Zn-dependent oxidoreductase